MDRFVVGSKAFFNGFDDFNPTDNDVLILEDKPSGYITESQIRLNGNCYFKWKRMSAKDFVEHHKKCKCGMAIGKFLVPDFAKEIGLTIDNLKELKCLYDLLDERHSYEKVIYDSYVENDGFFLTDEQRKKAYGEYKKYRN